MHGRSTANGKRRFWNPGLSENQFLCNDGRRFFAAFNATLYSVVAEKIHSYTLSLMISMMLFIAAIILMKIVMSAKLTEKN